MEWTEQDEKNLTDLFCMLNLHQEGKSYRFTPHRSYELRNWIATKFRKPNGKRPPIELLTWEEYNEV